MNVSAMLEFRQELVNRHGEELAAVDRVLQLVDGGGLIATTSVATTAEFYAVGGGKGLKGPKGKGGRLPGLTVEAAAAAKGNGARGDARPPGVSSDRQFAGGAGKLSDAIRVVCAKLPAGFSRLQVSERLPERFQNQAGKSSTATTLIGMIERGELTRTGQGSEARYTVAKLKAARGDARPPGGKPSEKEKAYQALRGEIHVPRDLEMEPS